MKSNLENKRKLKVVWLCHFANEEMKAYFKVKHINEFAPWISLSLQLFEGVDDVELHVVSPNVYTNTDAYLEKNGIHYHFYAPSPSIFNNRLFRRIYSFLNMAALGEFNWIKRKVSRTIRNIHPDIVHLHGAENAYQYSSGILPLIDEYPILTTIQGFIRNSIDNDRITKVRKAIEAKIIKNSQHFAIRKSDEMKAITEEMHPGADLYYHNYPVGKPRRTKENIGAFEPIDFIFFARVCKEKGIEDLLIAFSEVKKSIPNANLTVVGGVSDNYQDHLIKICKSCGILDSVKFEGFLPTQNDIYNLAYKAKVCVLPTYHDILPGTVLESMFLKLPVIAYGVGGLPHLNEANITIELVEVRNTKVLANRMEELYNDSAYRLELAERAYTHVNLTFDNNIVVRDIISAYRKVLAHKIF